MEQLGALRAEWLTQLAETIESAQRLAWQLRTREESAAEARELYDRLERARVELGSLMGLASSLRTRGDELPIPLDWLTTEAGSQHYTPSGTSPPPEKG